MTELSLALSEEERKFLMELLQVVNERHPT